MRFTQTDLYKPHIDSLRAIAVFLVLVQHWFDTALPVGRWGVILFFVVSGYLITGNIQRLQSQNLPLAHLAFQFFARRTARLLPAYYLLVCIWSLVSSQMRSDFWWYLLYGSNFLLETRQHWIAMTASWSLAVEEQFYFVWFFVVTLASRHRLVFVLAAMLILGPVCRYVYAVQANPFGQYMPWSNLDALAIGALLCVQEMRGFSLPSRLRPWGLGFLLAIVAILIGLDWAATTKEALSPLAIALLCVALLRQAKNSFRGLVGQLMGSPSLVYLGKISYGIYLYHMLTNALAANFAKIDVPGMAQMFAGQSAVGFVVHIGLTVILAALSFHFFELPIRQKVSRHFSTKS